MRQEAKPRQAGRDAASLRVLVWHRDPGTFLSLLSPEIRGLGLTLHSGLALSGGGGCYPLMLVTFWHM